jgi:hypothetical protein
VRLCTPSSLGMGWGILVGDEAQDGGDEALLKAARQAAEYQDQHGQPITRDALRARLGVSNQAACCASSARVRACRREPPAPPDRHGAAGGSTGTAKAWQPTGTGSPATGRPARGQHPPARFAAGPPLPARRAAAPGFPRAAGTVSGTGRPFIQVREPVTLPRRQLICLPIRIPAESGGSWRL